MGATEAINAAIFALFNPEDKILVPTPVFSLYWPVANLAGVQYSLVNTASDDFKLTAEKLEPPPASQPATAPWRKNSCCHGGLTSKSGTGACCHRRLPSAFPQGTLHPLSAAWQSCQS